MLKRGRAWAVTAVSLVLYVSGWISTPLQAQSAADKTVLDGTYTSAQAKRGEESYFTNCSKCHDDSSADVISIRGGQFVERWREQSLAPLFDFIKAKMPRDNPGGLSQQSYLDILSFLLQVNGYKDGQAELTEAALPSILFVGRDGPKPLPAGALVIAVGCLSPVAGGAWSLTNVGALVRTRISDSTTPEEVKSSQARALGSQTLQVRNLDLVDKFDPKVEQGHKVQLKGSYTASGSRIVAASAESLGATCP